MATADGMVSDPAARNGHAAFTAPATREELHAYVRENGIEFLFAQFVDMHGKPNAKLVPAHHLDGTCSTRAPASPASRRATSAKARTTRT
jgi:hypothetical protein